MGTAKPRPALGATDSTIQSARVAVCVMVGEECSGYTKRGELLGYLTKLPASQGLCSMRSGSHTCNSNAHAADTMRCVSQHRHPARSFNDNSKHAGFVSIST